MAASTALPPARNMSSPARAASGLAAAIMWRRAGAGRCGLEAVVAGTVSGVFSTATGATHDPVAARKTVATDNRADKDARRQPGARRRLDLEICVMPPILTVHALEGDR